MSVPGTPKFYDNGILVMNLKIGLYFTILFTLSCSSSIEPSLINIEIDSLERVEVPIDIQSANISRLNDGFASFRENSFNIDIWSFTFDKSYVLGSEGRGPGELGRISKIVSMGDEILILDTVNKSILKFDTTGKFIDIVYYDGMVMSLAADSQKNIYYGSVNFDRISIIKSTFDTFSKSQTIFSMPIRDLSQAAFDLKVESEFLLVNRYLSNQTIKIDLASGFAKTLANTYLPEEADFTQSGPYKLPSGPVWRTNAIIENRIFQLRNIPDSKSEIYRSDLNGNIDALFTFSHYTTNFFERGEEVWMFSPDSLYKYPKSSFLN